MITLKEAYNHYAQQDIPENIFDILFNHTYSSSSNSQSAQDQAMEEKYEIYQLLWNIIESKRSKKLHREKWIPGSVHFPSIIIQLLRARFPSSQTEILLPNCSNYSMKEFVLYTCETT
jgi:hypothetical protein